MMNVVRNQKSLRSINSIKRSLRSSSVVLTPDFQKQKSINIVIVSKTEAETKWPNFKLGPIDAVNRNYPLPGAVGTSDVLEVAQKPLNCKKGNIVSVVRNLPPSREDHYLYTLSETYNSTETNSASQDLIPTLPKELECAIHTCPSHVKQDLAPLFPDKRLALMQLNAVVLSRKTVADISDLEEVASEREDLAEQFITSAIDLCGTLKDMGYWADFINPFNGKPYLGARSDACMTETDERMANFGFTIEDVGCCKVIRHHRWNFNVFSGIIFTDAPKDHPLLLHFQIQ